MTPEDLAAIRARDAGCGSLNLWPPPYLSATEAAEAAVGAIVDRRALLAEVDRLTAQMDRLGWADNYLAGHNEGRSAERARIRAAVEGLRVRRTAKGENDYLCGFRQSRNETVAAVLDAIDGDEA